MMSSGTSVDSFVPIRESPADWLSWIVSHGLKNVVWFLTIASRFRRSAFWKRANGSLIGDRIATYATVASSAVASGSGIAL